jgi:putative endonuclease
MSLTRATHAGSKARRAGRLEPARRVAAERRGRLAELVAASLLVLKGYRILARRYRSRHGEIDLIAVRGRRLAFVEVKQRPTMAEAEASLTAGQAARIAEAAERWVWRRPRYRDHVIGLDAVLIAPGRLPRHAVDALQP